MRPDTLFIGHPVEILEKVNSTNSYALDFIKQSAPAEGYVVWGKAQFAGRGQRGAAWQSEPGSNLTFSIILRPQFLPVAEQFRLTKAIALGIASFVSHCVYEGIPLGEDGAHVRIKWPNDIYVKNCKIAGILIENVLEQSVLKYSVAGIGLNVNQVVFDPSLPNPISLKLLTGKDFNPEECLMQLCSFIEKQYLDLRAVDYPSRRDPLGQIDGAYHNLLYRRGIWADFTLHGQHIWAKIEGVNRSGHLILQQENAVNNSYETVVVTDIKQLVFL